MMRINKRKHLPLVLCIFFLIYHCSNNPSQYAGGSSGTEVSVVTGIAQNPDGTPAANAIVKIRPVDYLSDSASSSAYLTSHSVRDTVTGPDGSFNFDSIIPDSYYIEVASGDTISVLTEVSVDSGRNRYSLSENMLMPMAEIVVKVEISSRDSCLGQLQVYGMERAIYADSNGYFTVRVPSGSHVIHLDAISPDPSKPHHSDIEGLDVKLNMGIGEKRDIGTFNLAQPSIKPCLDGHCDSITIKKILDTLEMENIPSDSVCSWHNGRIDSVTFRGRQLKFVPRDLIRLLKVTSLDLGKTGLNYFPFDITLMRCITSLYLDSNNLSQIPKEIGILSNCRILNLSGNTLKSLPHTITGLSPNILLDLSGNNLCDTDKEIEYWADKFDREWRSTQNCQ